MDFFELFQAHNLPNRLISLNNFGKIFRLHIILLLFENNYVDSLKFSTYEFCLKTNLLTL